ncbi:hypothetical protein BYT27DRAFT_6688568 [Phlegmacium glaucopus]|nr:hypothetical protein BYT27DRAFT_6688568 [Phlegmacium glaucopus]
MTVRTHVSSPRACSQIEVHLFFNLNTINHRQLSSFLPIILYSTAAFSTILFTLYSVAQPTVPISSPHSPVCWSTGVNY